MTNIDRLARQILHDPWISRVFLAFTVGLFLSCSAEFAAGDHSIEWGGTPRIGAAETPQTPAAPLGQSE